MEKDYYSRKYEDMNDGRSKNVHFRYKETFFDENGEIGRSSDKPSIIFYSEIKEISRELFYRNGRTHRENGYADITYSVGVGSQIPTDIIYKNYYLEGVYYSESAYSKEMKIRNRKKILKDIKYGR